MDLKTKKQEQFQKALKSLFEVIHYTEKNAIIRDSAIQRFEYTSELFWKMLKEVLEKKYGIIAKSPKSVIREAVAQNICSAEDGELFLQMMNDRNRTSHAYEEAIADEIEGRLEEYALEMEEVWEDLETEGKKG